MVEFAPLTNASGGLSAPNAIQSTSPDSVSRQHKALVTLVDCCVEVVPAVNGHTSPAWVWQIWALVGCVSEDYEGVNTPIHWLVGIYIILICALTFVKHYIWIYLASSYIVSKESLQMQTGSSPDHSPVIWQIREREPLMVYPSLQLYVAVKPKDVPDSRMFPFCGASSRPQSTSTQQKYIYSHFYDSGAL